MSAVMVVVLEADARIVVGTRGNALLERGQKRDADVQEGNEPTMRRLWQPSVRIVQPRESARPGPPRR